MRGLRPLALISIFVLISACRSDHINFSKALFEHIPDDPQVLVLVRPNDVMKVAEMTLSQIDLNEVLGTNLNVDMKLVTHYQKVALDMLSALGIPIENVESIGFMLYFNKPVLMVSGDFGKDQVVTKLQEIGFKQNDNQFFDYVYGDQKLHVPANGLMMMADEGLLDFLTTVPTENRLWNREDFAEYRLRSPMDRSLFIWSNPPEDFLSEFKYREELTDLSLAVDFKSDVTFQLNIRLRSPEKTVLLYDVVFGSLKLSQGLFGDDQDFGPLLKSIQVSQDNSQVVANLVVPYAKVERLKDRLFDDSESSTSETFEKLRSLIERFN